MEKQAQDFNSIAATLNSDSLLSEDLLTNPAQLKPEPDDNDLSELEDLLQESVKLSAASKPQTNRRIYKDLKQSTEAMLAEHLNKVSWEILDTISVWQRTKCSCGGLGGITFVRFMQKLKKVGSKTLHWETTEAPAEGEVVRKTLVTREVAACWECVKGDGKFEDFREVIK